MKVVASRFARTLVALSLGIVIGAGRIDGQTSAVPRKQLVEELRLGAAQNLPSIGRVAIGPRGLQAVVAEAEQQVFLFDAQGSKIGVAGRLGVRPGEFRNITLLGWLADTLWAFDTRLTRFTFISPTASVMRNEALLPELNVAPNDGSKPIPGMVASFAPRGITPTGLLIGQGTTVPNEGAAVASPRLAIMTVSFDGGRPKIIAYAPKTDDVSVRYQPADGSLATMGLPFAFFPQTQYATDGSRVAFLEAESGDTPSYTVTSIRTNGDTIFHRTYPVTGVPISAKSRDSALAAIANMKQGGKPLYGAAAAASLREQATARMPKVYAPVSALTVGVDNTTWVSMRRNEQGTEVVGLDARGNPVASFVVPAKARLVQASRGQVWLLEQDAAKKSSLVRYRLQ